MSRFETTFRTAIANAERDVLVDQIRANPQMSLSELGKLATGELGNLLKQITVADLVGSLGGHLGGHLGGNLGGTLGASKTAAAAPATRGRKPGSKNKPKVGAEEGRKAVADDSRGEGRKAKAEPAGRKPKAAQDEVDTRTAEGRGAYDHAVLAALQAASGPQSASELTAVAGGSPLQIRTALARLIDAGSVNWSGRARGTRYTPA